MLQLLHTNPQKRHFCFPSLFSPGWSKHHLLHRVVGSGPHPSLIGTRTSKQERTVTCNTWTAGFSQIVCDKGSSVLRTFPSTGPSSYPTTTCITYLLRQHSPLQRRTPGCHSASSALRHTQSSILQWLEYKVVSS